MTFKRVTGAVGGDATHFGGTDVNKFSDFLGGTDIGASETVDVATLTAFRNSKFTLRNPANTFSYVFVPSAIAASRNVTLPLLTAADQMTLDAHATTLTNKTVSAEDNPLLLFSPEQYVIYKSGSTYKALNRNTGTILSSGTTDASIQINAAIDDINDAGEGGQIYIKRGIYNCLTTINLIPHSANIVRGMSITGDGYESCLNFAPGSALTDGLFIAMSNARLQDFRVLVNSNVTNAIRFTGNSGGGGDRGMMDHVEVDGPNAGGSGAPVAGQTGIFQDGATAAPYWWGFSNMMIRAFENGFKASGLDATSTQWVNSNFWNCTNGMYIDAFQHIGSNLWFQGSTAYGRYGIRITTNGDSNTFSNLFAELHVTATNCAVVLLDSGASANCIIGAGNEFNDGVNFFNLIDNSAATNNTFFTLDGITCRGNSIKIGTTTGNKVGFFGVTPVVQQAANPNTTGAALATLETEVNQVKQTLRNFGLIAP